MACHCHKVRRIMPEMEEGEAKSRAKAEPKNSSKMLGSVKRPGRSRKMRKLETQMWGESFGVDHP